MIDYKELSALLFPDVTMTEDDVEKMFPQREGLPEGAVISRMAPSPTGFVHLGNLVQGLTSERMCHQSGGILYLRVEDTDAKREVPGAVETLIESLSHYGICFDEGATVDGDNGSYGPYRQRQRKDIYHVFAKKLLLEGQAYPCFCTEEELTAIHEKQEAEKANFGYFGKWALWRDRSVEDIKAALDAGKPFTVSDLAISGNHLKAAGWLPGAEIGQALEALLEAVMDGLVPNETDALFALAQDLRKEKPAR